MYSRRQETPIGGMNALGGVPPRRGRLGALLSAALLAVAGFSSTVAAQELTTLYPFTGTGSGDGAYPNAGLIADPAGNLYGTTQVGGADPSCNQAPGCGTVFQLTASGTLTVLHSFTGSDGASPEAGLLADAAGNLYGTTHSGGAATSCVQGCGTVFELTVPASLTGAPSSRNMITKRPGRGASQMGRR